MTNGGWLRRLVRPQRNHWLTPFRSASAALASSNEVKDTAQNIFLLQFLDTGTPCSVDFTDITYLNAVTSYPNANGNLYFVVQDLDQNKNPLSAETVTICIYPIIFYLSTLYGNVTTRRYYTGVITPCFIIFNLLYVSIIGIMIRFKKDDNYEKK